MASEKKSIPYFDTADTKPDSVLLNSKITLAELFSDTKIDFQRRDSSDKTIFELRGKGAYSYPIDESRCVLYPISIDDGIFLINLGVLFSQISNKFLFSGVSLKVYKHTSEKIILLFRAEWDAIKGGNVHAQPHWHMNFNDLGKNEEEVIDSREFKEAGVEEFTGVEEQEAVEIKELAYFSKFHFAMSADWHNGGRHLFRLEDEKALARWLKGCLEYIIAQLQYVSAHH
jgi:hypothetical protein